jgi:phage shock protein PspC (stress-responsive transcriptional regulator)
MSYTTPTPDAGPRVTREQMRDISTLRRARKPRMVAGVAEGLSRHFDIDPLLIRVAFFALVFFGGSGICLYVIAWLSIPEEGKHDSALSKLFRADPNRVMGAGLVFAGIVAAVTLVGAIGFTAPNPWPLLVVSAIAFGALALYSRRGERPPPPPWPTTPGTPSAPPSGPAQPTEDAPTSQAPSPPPTRAWWQRPLPPGGGGTPPSPYGPYAPPPPPPPPPRERSHLFGLTMAASAIAVGIVWFLDQGPFDAIVPAAYPATILGVTAIGLIVGTLFGRSRLLIAVGVVAALATAAMAFLGPGPYGERIYRPAAASEVQSTYTNGVGRLVVHLEEIANPRQLDGMTVRIDEHVGALEVIVPSTMPVTIDAQVEHGEVAGPRPSVENDLSGGNQEAHLSSVAAGGTPALVLDIHLDYGQIAITQYDCDTRGTASTTSTPSTGLDTTRRIGGTDAAPACP